MKFAELLDKFVEKGARAFVNGFPEEGGGKILKREEDYIVFEFTKPSQKQEDTTREKIFIPISQIFSLSQGERKAGTLAGCQNQEQG
jgi:hypothetical protein